MHLLSNTIYGYEVILSTCGTLCPVCTGLAYNAAEAAWLSEQSKALSIMYLTDDGGNVIRHEVTAHRVCAYAGTDNEPF